MVNTVIAIFSIVFFFFLGYFTPAFKKIISLLTSLGLKFLNLFGIKIRKKERHLKMSDEFKQTYKDIKIVKLSKKNIKQKHSIDFIGLTVLLIAIILFIVNLGNVTGNAISNWIYEWASKIPLIGGMFANPAASNTFFTAMLFSIISFSISRILNRWKETKQQRIERKNAKIKKKAIELMDSKDLVDAAKKKDIEKEKELK